MVPHGIWKRYIFRHLNESEQVPFTRSTLRPDGATRGAATGSTSDLGEAVSGIAVGGDGLIILQLLHFS